MAFLSTAKRKKSITQASIIMAMLTGVGVANAQEGGRLLYQVGVEGKAKIPLWQVVNNIYGTWINSGVPKLCLEWAPPTNTVPWGEAYQQSRVCQQDQVRTVTPIMLNPILSATKEGEVYSEGRTISVTQYQPATGLKDFIADERLGAWGSWVDEGGHYRCTPWSPTPDTVNLGASFTQSNECLQDQRRSRQVYHVWASSKETPKRIDEEERVVRESNAQVSTGTKDYVEGTSVKPWSSWVNDGGVHTCSAWSPSPDTVPYGEAFTKNRVCKQEQSRSRDVYEVWASGKETFLRTEPDTQSIDVTQAKEDYGTDPGVTGQSAGAWQNYGSPTNCSSWTPDRSSVNLGQSFTQTRSCDQQQRQSVTTTTRYSDGTQQSSSSYNYKTVRNSYSNPTTGTKDYVTSTRWVYSHQTLGGKRNCSSWSPSRDSVDEGTRFTQSQSCKHTVYKYYDKEYTYKSGKVTRDNQNWEDSSKRGETTKTYTQSTTGTKQTLTWKYAGSRCDSARGVSYGGGAWGSCSVEGETRDFTEGEGCQMPGSNNYASGVRIYTYTCSR
jgi:hypothetical protein